MPSEMNYLLSLDLEARSESTGINEFDELAYTFLWTSKLPYANCFRPQKFVKATFKLPSNHTPWRSNFHDSLPQDRDLMCSRPSSASPWRCLIFTQRDTTQLMASQSVGRTVNLVILFSHILNLNYHRLIVRWASLILLVGIILTSIGLPLICLCRVKDPLQIAVIDKRKPWRFIIPLIIVTWHFKLNNKSRGRHRFDDRNCRISRTDW